ncbi:MAG TPA: hypothetical protein PK079_09555 [Leptospiraceae bacterium]|nr:hypothetical protein [Leptospiraceae bacterium]HMW04551.1 hypothetical protein [Leptospiraceae bacterium]HMX33454.1 hypothetical protein [Leptospiraceae bacterium]HMY30737.1 hypothetical protein [Leptospiraceae bacterium]HMZ64315.1 hypothetical protein [Leptospiraceae bacterium]
MLFKIFLVISVIPILSILAEPSCELDSSKEKLYRLELTVPATFCSKANNDPSCATFPKKSILQLHGLWPNYTKGYPEGICDSSECKNQSEKLGKFCKYPSPKGLYSSEMWKKMSDYMAGTEKCLERHEWVKHGICSPLEPVTYFKWALEKTKLISGAFEPLKNRTISRQEVNEAVEKNLPDLVGSIRMNCKGKNLSSVYVLYEWGNTPGNPIKTKGGENGFGNCPKSFFISSSPE